MFNKYLRFCKINILSTNSSSCFSNWSPITISHYYTLYPTYDPNPSPTIPQTTVFLLICLSILNYKLLKHLYPSKILCKLAKFIHMLNPFAWEINTLNFTSPILSNQMDFFFVFF